MFTYYIENGFNKSPIPLSPFSSPLRRLLQLKVTWKIHLSKEDLALLRVTNNLSPGIFPVSLLDLLQSFVSLKWIKCGLRRKRIRGVQQKEHSTWRQESGVTSRSPILLVLTNHFKPFEFQISSITQKQQQQNKTTGKM